MTLVVQIAVVTLILFLGALLVYAAFVPPYREMRRASENLARRGEREGLLERGGRR